MTSHEMECEASTQAAYFFEHEKNPTYIELCEMIRSYVGDQPYVPRFAAMILAKLNEFRSAFAGAA